MHAEDFVFILKKCLFQKPYLRKKFLITQGISKQKTQLSLLLGTSSNSEQAKVRKMKDAYTNTDRFVRGIKGSGDTTSDLNEKHTEMFVSDHSEIEPTVKKKQIEPNSAFHSIILKLKLVGKNTTKRAALTLKTIFYSKLPFLFVSIFISSSIIMSRKEWR